MNELQLFANGIELTEIKQQSWILLGKGKAKLDTELQKKELELQSFLLTGTLIERLTAYKKGYTDMVEFRKSYTKFLDLAKDQCMIIEKRCDPKINASFLLTEKDELRERVAAAEEHKKTVALAEERSAFKAHVINELATQAHNYGQEMITIINKAYTTALVNKIPVSEIFNDFGLTEQQIKMVQLQPIAKYARTLLSDEEAKKIYNEIPKVNKNEILAECTFLLQEKFSMYANDLANAAAIIEQEKINNDAAAVKAKAELEQQKATTTLISSAEAFVMPEGKGVKELTSIVIEDEDQQWIMKIISAFIANFPTAFPKIRNKKYSSLTVAQMAAALDAAEIVVSGVKYQTVCK